MLRGHKYIIKLSNDWPIIQWLDLDLRYKLILKRKRSYQLIIKGIYYLLMTSDGFFYILWPYLYNNCHSPFVGSLIHKCFFYIPLLLNPVQDFEFDNVSSTVMSKSVCFWLFCPEEGTQVHKYVGVIVIICEVFE